MQNPVLAPDFGVGTESDILPICISVQKNYTNLNVMYHLHIPVVELNISEKKSAS